MVPYKAFIQDNARWDGFSFRDGDIVISTPPKCGTTWMQMICALLIFQSPELPKPLDQLSPWLDQLTARLDEVVAVLEVQEHRRFIKSHTPLDGLPFDDRVTYICVGRDPRDAAISWDNHMQNVDGSVMERLRGEAVGNDDLPPFEPRPDPATLPTPAERFWRWVDDPGLLHGLAPLLHHVQTFWDVRDRRNIVLLHYADLKADVVGQMRRLASRLGIDVPDSMLPTLAEAASFEHMRANAERVAPNATQRVWRDTARFFNSGTSGQWHDLLDAEDAARFERRVAELVSPDLAAWLTRG